MKYYSVAKGRSTGIFVDWYSCQRSVNKFPNCCFKSFDDYDDALLWLRARGIIIKPMNNGPITKFFR